jgi:predicted acylesterase/phospholipase RssA
MNSLGLDQPTPYWYSNPGVVDVWFQGVFEGGGAKGVAYSGALLAMKEMRSWFSGVAGASAGAITAALVASGMSPEELEQATDSALKLVRTGRWAGIRRLRSETGYFPSRELLVWLDQLLRTQLARGNAIVPTGRITFRQLYDATRIELNVIAADLSIRRQVVFSHLDTPNCAVADAVVASSAIPFAFPSQLLQVAQRDNPNAFCHHTIVDGGVWSNLPMFVFEDSAFRRHYHRVPESLPPNQVLGFILAEGEEPRSPRGEDVAFVEAVSPGHFQAREWISDRGSTEAAPESFGAGARLAARLLYPFALLARFLEWNGGMERGRWPQPRSPLARNLVLSINGLLGGIYPPLAGALACAVVMIGAWSVIRFAGIDQLHAVRATDWAQAGSYFMRPISGALTLLAIGVAVLTVFVTVFGVAVNFALLRPARRILYGLVTTYVAGPGASEWIAEKDNVIALPIPSTVTTLSFELSSAERQDLIARARQATIAKLALLLNVPSQRSGI